MWYERSVFYQIYPLGFCAAPQTNDGVLKNRIERVIKWIPHLEKLHVGAVLFNPIFESDAHGYDTRDLTQVDVRLGTNDDFAAVCAALHAAGMRVVLDGVFNHVGREHVWVQRALAEGPDSEVAGLARIDWSSGQG
ncbi:MAG: alpha-amylase family glycosyl hydrolase, partial [Oscillospiraceae bacterium]